MKKIVSLFVLFIAAFSSQAQKLSKENFQKLSHAEDSLKVYSHAMIQSELAPQRFDAMAKFTPMFVDALKIPQSFDYAFDSLETISITYAPDTSFRIFTWEMEKDESYFRQYGAIQINTKDGSLKLFPLIDASDFTENPVDSIRTNTNWIGAIYYGIVMKTFHGKKYYSLLGFDDNSIESTKKWLEVLTFDDKGDPQFGGQYFSYPEDSIKPAQPAFRFCLEYKKDAKARMDYDPDLDMIVFEHLISENHNVAEKFTLIPDGDYEAFKWQNGKWIYVNKVFTQKLENGQFPMPDPIKNDDGSSDENKLNQQSDKNMKPKPQ